MRWIAALLTWFAADPQAIDDERPRAAACVQAAHASLQRAITEDDDDAAKNQNTEAAVGGAGESGTAEAGRLSEANSGRERIRLEKSQGLATGCADGRCVDVSRVRTSSQRKR
jgi:hypothetical protein